MNAFMDSARRSYTDRIRFMALREGFALVKVPGDNAQPNQEDQPTLDSTCEHDDPCLYMLLNEKDGTETFPLGATIGDIEDYLDAQVD